MPCISDEFRTQLCKLNDRIEQIDPGKKHLLNDPPLLRFGNTVMINVFLLLIIIMTIGVYWKRRQQKKPMRVSNGNVNVITLNQTVILMSLISLDNTGLSYVINLDNFLGLSEDLVFKLETFRVILIENIFFKFCVPLYFLIDSKAKLPSLWAERDDRKLDFFLTGQTFIARPVVFKYKVESEQTGCYCHQPEIQHHLIESQHHHLESQKSHSKSHRPHKEIHLDQTHPPYRRTESRHVIYFRNSSIDVCIDFPDVHIA